MNGKNCNLTFEGIFLILRIYIFRKTIITQIFFTYLLKFILLIYGENRIFSPIEKRLKIDISVIFILIFLERKAKNRFVYCSYMVLLQKLEDCPKN